MNRKGAYLAAVGLLFLFGACEKEVSESVSKGGKVEIFFSTDITGYHTAGDMVRSGIASEPISTMIPLNGDFHLRATFVPDSEEELRTNEAFMNEQKLCFAAFKTDGSEQVGATAVYSYSTARSKWEPVGEPLGVVPDNIKEYRFVAYSYFENTATPAVTGIDPAYDLVWGMSVDTKIEDDSEAARTVTIHMTHKFARVKVRVRSTKIATATITALSGVEVGDGKLASLDPFSGDITLGSAATQGVNITVPSPAEDDIESLYRTVTPVGTGTVNVKLGTVKVSTASSTTFSNKWAAFNGTLDEAKSYTLVVDLKRGVGFAYSNIYWEWYDDDDGDPDTHLNGGHLTFDTTDKGNQGYQGVLFKWGSLVGISAAQTGSGDAFSYSSTPIYVPTYNSSTPISSTWQPTTATAKSWTTWGDNKDIPYLNPAGGNGHTRDDTYVIDAARNTDAMYQGFYGDICQYLSKTGAVTGNYRLPTANELGPGTGWTSGGRTTADNTLGDAEGMIDLLTVTNDGAWAKNAAMEDVVFPASGNRNHVGTLGSVGSAGHYWSGGSSDGQGGYHIGFSSSSVSPNGIVVRRYGFAVRCVQK
jgi:hypothetical protein